MSSVIQNIKIAQIRTDGGTQPRAALNEATVAEYAESITEGAKMPPISVYHDGADYWLADGFHRFHAHRKIGASDINAEVHQGTKRDAILHSVGANAAHGLRRTNEDKRKAVLTLLEDSEWSQWSDREISRQCGVGNKFVGDVRRSICVPNTDTPPATRLVERGGKTYEQKTVNIGKKSPVGHDTPTRNPTRTLEAMPLQEDQVGESDELAEAHHTIIDLAAENERLLDRLAVQQMDASEAEKQHAAGTIADLRRKVSLLEGELEAVKISRDTYMQKVGEMQKQINFWRKKAEKVAA